MRKRKPNVLILGPDLNKKKPGGIVSVIRMHLASGLKDPYELSWQSLEYEGRPVQKLKDLFRQLLKLWRIFRKERYDLIHVHASLYQSVVLRLVFILWVKYWAKTPMLLHFHGGTGAHIKRYQSLFRKQLSQFEYILVLTEVQKNGLVHDAKVPAEKIELVPNYSLSPTRNNKKQLKAGLQQSILFMGRMIREKGIFELVEAIHQIKTQLEGKAQVIMAGDGPDLAQVQKQIKAYDLEKIIHLPGFVTGDQKRQLLEKATIFVLPSYNEGFPMSILEAMSYGQAIIATNQGQTKDLVQENNGVLLTTLNTTILAEVILELVNQPSLVAQMGKASENLFQSKFRMEDKGVEHFSRIYDQLICS